MSMPSPKSNSGYDRVSGTTGLVCESSVSTDTYFEIGSYANEKNDKPRHYYGSSNDSKFGTDNDSFGVYARVIIPLTGAKKRVDCNRLYNLEIEKLKLEIERLKLASKGGSVDVPNDEVLFE